LDNGLAKNSVKPRTKPFLLKNKGIEEITLTISCSMEEVNKSTKNISICDYVTFSETEFKVLANEQQDIIGYVNVLTPPDSEFGDIYYFNILAKETTGTSIKVSKLSVSNRVTFLSLVYKWSYMPILKEREDGSRRIYPVGFPAFILSFLIFLLIFLAFNRANKPIAGFTIGLIFSTGMFILFLLIM